MIRDPSRRARGRWLVVVAAVFVLLGYLWLLALNRPDAVERQTATGTVNVEGADAVDVEVPPGEDDQAEEGTPRRTVAFRFAVLLGIPALSLIAALVVTAKPGAVVTRTIAAVVYGGLGLLTAFSAGPFFLVAAALLLVAAILATATDHQ